MLFFCIILFLIVKEAPQGWPVKLFFFAGIADAVNKVVAGKIINSSIFQFSG